MLYNWKSGIAHLWWGSTGYGCTHTGLDIWELLSSPILKYGSYRSHDLKLLPVIPVLTLECACVEWYGTCTTFARYTLGGIVCMVV